MTRLTHYAFPNWTLPNSQAEVKKRYRNLALGTLQGDLYDTMTDKLSRSATCKYSSFKTEIDGKGFTTSEGKFQ